MAVTVVKISEKKLGESRLSGLGICTLNEHQIYYLGLDQSFIMLCSQTQITDQHILTQSTLVKMVPPRKCGHVVVSFYSFAVSEFCKKEMTS